MKFLVNFKDPDTLQNAIAEAVDELTIEGITDDEEIESVKEVRKDKITKLCTRWFKWGEYLCVEIDTEAETCTVMGAD